MDPTDDCKGGVMIVGQALIMPIGSRALMPWDIAALGNICSFTRPACTNKKVSHIANAELTVTKAESTTVLRRDTNHPDLQLVWRVD